MSAPLTGTCEGCGAPDGLYQPHMETVYCPRCAANQDAYDRARHTLAALVAPAVRAWHQHWTARGLSPEELLEIAQYSDYLEDIVSAANAGPGMGTP